MTRTPAGLARDREVELRLAAVTAEARRRNPEWEPWMREWCTVTNFGERRKIGWRARRDLGPAWGAARIAARQS